MFNLKNITLLLLSLLALPIHAEQMITAGDGKQYQLNDDGTWALVSENRHLDTPDGRRVVLMPNGKWQYAGLAPEVSEEKFQSLDLAASIDNIKIYETREAVGGGKNTRITYQTVVTLALSLADETTEALALDTLKRNDFSLSDNKGKRYPIVDIQSSVNSLAPGETASLTIISNKAPKRLRKTAEFVLNLNAQTLGNTDDIILSYNYDLVERETTVK